jgi:hypothetical protein
MNTFLERHKISLPEPPVVVHDGAPPVLRKAVYRTALQAGVSWATMFELIRTRIVITDYSNSMTLDLIVMNGCEHCEWYELYDFAEAIYAYVGGERHVAHTFESLLNASFRKLGVGWWMHNGLIERRGSKPFEETVHGALDALDGAGLGTSSGELRKALHDLSVRPHPDITGAIQHAGAALECTMREICEDPKPTLGQLLKDNPGKVPPPLDTAVEKIWGYASEMGRHLREGRMPELDEALLAVQTSAAVTTYLIAKWQKP